MFLINLLLLVLCPGISIILTPLIKKWGYDVLIVSLSILVLLSNILVLIPVSIGPGLVITGGLYLYGLTYLLTDIIHELYGYEKAKHAVNVSMTMPLIYVIVAVITHFLSPVRTMPATKTVLTIFNLTPRVMLASIVVYYLSNILDVYVFEHVKHATRGKYLFARNILGEVTADIFDTCLFFILAFYGVWNTQLLIHVIYSTLIGKWILHLVDTPYLYACLKLLKNNNDRSRPLLNHQYSLNISMLIPGILSVHTRTFVYDVFLLCAL